MYKSLCTLHRQTCLMNIKGSINFWSYGAAPTFLFATVDYNVYVNHTGSVSANPVLMTK